MRPGRRYGPPCAKMRVKAMPIRRHPCQAAAGPSRSVPMPTRPWPAHSSLRMLARLRMCWRGRRASSRRCRPMGTPYIAPVSACSRNAKRATSAAASPSAAKPASRLCRRVSASDRFDRFGTAPRARGVKTGPYRHGAHHGRPSCRSCLAGDRDEKTCRACGGQHLRQPRPVRAA